MTDRARRADIQGLRGLAVLLVVVFHAGWRLPGGFVGVDVFFVISGFVITNLLWSEVVTTGELRLGHFYARRVRRLLPALAVVLVVTAAASVLLNPISTERQSAVTGIAAAIFSANAYLYHLGSGYFDPATTLIPLLHTWTLAVEEQFYAVFPVVVLVAHRLARRRRPGSSSLVAVASAVAVVTAASFALSLHLTYGGSIAGIGLPDQLAFYGSPARAWEFGVGSLLALGGAGLARLHVRAATALGLGGLVAILASTWAFDGRTAFPGVAALLPVLGAAAVLAAGIVTTAGAPRLLGTRLLVRLGDLSYSWYLWHWPVIVFTRAVWPTWGAAGTVAAVGSLLPAIASYRYVEQPTRANRRIAGRRAVALAGFCVAVPVLAGMGLLVAHRATDRTASIQQWHRTRATHLDWSHGCVGPTLGAAGTDACTWSVPSARGTVVLLGDSNAGHFSEPVVEAANDAGYDARVATRQNCPFIDLTARFPRDDRLACGRFVAASLAEVVRIRPSLVILAARTAGYVEDDLTSLRLGRGAWHDDPVTKAQLWERGLASTLRTLNDAGIPVLVVHPVPTFPTSPDDCAIVRLLRGPCAQVRSRAAVERRRRRSSAAEDAAVAGATLARAVDPMPYLCSATRCSTQRGQVSMYTDDSHLSVGGARLLTGMFSRAIEAAARPAHSG